MAKSAILERGRQKKQTVMVDVFAGIDRSTYRARIEGKGERLYEAKNIFPYIQGKLQRRRDSVQTNSRDSNNAFPTFPATSLTGNPVVKKVIDWNNNIIIIYEDDGDKGKLLVDSFDTGTNTLTARINKTSNGGGAYTFTNDGLIDAVTYSRALFIDLAGSKVVTLNLNWTNSITATGNNGFGICETFLQTFFHINSSEPERIIGRTAPSSTTQDVVAYNLEEISSGNIIKILSFGYQTSSAGATTSMLIFKASTIYVLTGIGATESMEQVTGNIGLVGKEAVTYTPFGICFVGRDTDGLLNIYLIDRNYFTLQTIGHELYEELNNIPPANYTNIVLSYHLNRMVRIAITSAGSAEFNDKEYWLDFYNGLKKRTLWGPFPIIASNSMTHAISFSGGNTPADAGYFKLLKEGDTTKIYEDVKTDTYSSSDSEWDDQVWRTKMYDFGEMYGIVIRIYIIALKNGAKFKVYYEKPKAGGDDDDTTSVLIGSFQMGTDGNYKSKPIRIVPAILAKQIAIKIESDYDVTDNNPLEPLQIGFDYEVTGRETIE